MAILRLPVFFGRGLADAVADLADVGEGLGGGRFGRAVFGGLFLLGVSRVAFLIAGLGRGWRRGRCAALEFLQHRL